MQVMRYHVSDGPGLSLIARLVAQTAIEVAGLRDGAAELTAVVMRLEASQMTLLTELRAINRQLELTDPDGSGHSPS